MPDNANRNEVEAPRYLLYGPTQEGCDFLHKSLPMQWENIDVFTDYAKAKEALSSGKYSLLLADQTVIDTTTRDLLFFAIHNSIEVQAFSIVRTTHPRVEAQVWKISEDHRFRRGNIEIDNLTIPLSGIIREDSPLRWVSIVRNGFFAIRNRVQEQPGQCVLLVGAAGTSKLSLAQIAHTRGKRCHGPFLFASCHDVPLKHHRWSEEEKKLFRGNIKTMIEQAAGGTLYFHEVDLLDLDAQDILADELARCKHSSTKKSIPIVTVCATRRNVSEMEKEELFSSKLMNVLKDNVIRVPALYEHNDEVVEIAKELLTSYCSTWHLEPKYFSKEMEKELADWNMGHNMRELFALILEGYDRSKNAVIGINDITFKPTIIASDSEKDKACKIKAALIHTNGNVSKAAKEMGIARNTLYLKMQELGIPKSFGRGCMPDDETKAKPKDE